MAQKIADALNKEGKITFKSGTTSTRQNRLSLIPHKGLVNAARRFELGLEIHGSQAWNNLSPNYDEALKDKEWLIERCSHSIEHAYKMIDILTGKSNDSLLDHAGAVAWCGLVLGSVEPEEIL